MDGGGQANRHGSNGHPIQEDRDDPHRKQTDRRKKNLEQGPIEGTKKGWVVGG